jgi:predicted GIY-YIG superfamily endonuclease
MSGYGHRIEKRLHDLYVVSWEWDRKYAGSRLRYPQRIKRHTDRKGAERFAKKWGCQLPEEG